MQRESDIVMLEKSMADLQLKNSGVLDKHVLFINDSNNGSYNGSIQIDSTVLSNSGRWLDYTESVLEMPCVIKLTSSVDMLSPNPNQFITTLKSGAFQLIDSIQVDYNNKNIVQSQSFTNFHTSYRVLSSWSSDDVKKYGDLTYVLPDSEASSLRSSVASPNGAGITNNRVFNEAIHNFTSSASKQSINEGLEKRLELTTDKTGNGGITQSEAQLNQSGNAYYNLIDNKTNEWYIIATIRLKDLCDVFNKLPLIRGAQMRFTINYNAARVAITNTASNLGVPAITMISGRTCPFMISSASVNQPSLPLLKIGTFTIENSISSAHPALKSCRLYVPSYRLSPDIELLYLSASPVKEVDYTDIYQYTITSVSAGSQFNQLLTNAIVNPKKLIIVPMFSKQASTANIEQYQNPFDSAPFTTAPSASITNFQVQISGQNIFNQATNYTWEQYLYEISKSGVESGLVTGLSSGLLSKKGFENSYSYIVVDLSRRTAGEDMIPKSIQVSGTNNTSFDMTYYCFIEYGRGININLSQGSLV